MQFNKKGYLSALLVGVALSGCTDTSIKPSSSHNSIAVSPQNTDPDSKSVTHVDAEQSLEIPVSTGIALMNAGTYFTAIKQSNLPEGSYSITFPGIDQEDVGSVINTLTVLGAQNIQKVSSVQISYFADPSVEPDIEKYLQSLRLQSSLIVYDISIWKVSLKEGKPINWLDYDNLMSGVDGFELTGVGIGKNPNKSNTYSSSCLNTGISENYIQPFLENTGVTELTKVDNVSLVDGHGVSFTIPMNGAQQIVDLNGFLVDNKVLTDIRFLGGSVDYKKSVKAYPGGAVLITDFGSKKDSLVEYVALLKPKVMLLDPSQQNVIEKTIQASHSSCATETKNVVNTREAHKAMMSKLAEEEQQAKFAEQKRQIRLNKLSQQRKSIEDSIEAKSEKKALNASILAKKEAVRLDLIAMQAAEVNSADDKIFAFKQKIQDADRIISNLHAQKRAIPSVKLSLKEKNQLISDLKDQVVNLKKQKALIIESNSMNSQQIHALSVSSKKITTPFEEEIAALNTKIAHYHKKLESVNSEQSFNNKQDKINFYNNVLSRLGKDRDDWRVRYRNRLNSLQAQMSSYNANIGRGNEKVNSIDTSIRRVTLEIQSAQNQADKLAKTIRNETDLDRGLILFERDRLSYLKGRDAAMLEKQQLIASQQINLNSITSEIKVLNEEQSKIIASIAEDKLLLAEIPSE